MHRHCLELDLHRLDLRFAGSRLVEPRAVARMAQSIERCGQIVPCIVVASSAEALVLVDGYRRVAALRRLGRDTASVEQWACDLTEALLGVLARNQDRRFAIIEEALLLRELVQGLGLSQHAVAQRCGRDVSWISRRLHLLSGLPRCGVGGGAWRHAVELGGQPGGGAAGARQHRACRAPAGGVDRDAADDPGVAVLVRTLSAGRARRPRAHGQPTAPVPRRRAGEPGAPCRRAPARRPRRRVHQRSALPRGGDRTSAQACGHAASGAAAADRGSAAPAGSNRRPDDSA